MECMDSELDGGIEKIKDREEKVDKDG